MAFAVTIHEVVNYKMQRVTNGNAQHWLRSESVTLGTSCTIDTWTLPWLPVVYRVAQKIGTLFLYALTLPNINRFSKLFHCQNQQKICNNTVTKDPTTPQVCRYTIPCQMSAFHWSRHWSVASPAWVRRPAARRAHWTFDVKTAWCDSYFRQ